MKKLFVAGFFVISVMFTVAAAAPSVASASARNPQQFVGVWVGAIRSEPGSQHNINVEISLEFRANGTGMFLGIQPLTWRAQNGQMHVTMEGEDIIGGSVTSVWRYRFDGATLILNMDGSDVRMTRHR